MPERKKLDEAIEEILDAIRDLVLLQAQDGGTLEGVASVVRGDRTRTGVLTPSVWLFAESARNEHPPRALHETWTFPVVLTSVVKADDTEEGYRKATRIAARARSAVLANRTLGLRYVQDTRSSRFDAAAPWQREGNLFAAVAVVEVVFTILE